MTSLYLLLVVAPLCAAPPKRDLARNELPARAAAIFDEADSVVLFSLDRVKATSEKGSDKPPADRFHGWRVLGQVQMKDAKARQALLGQVRKGIYASRDGQLGLTYFPDGESKTLLTPWLGLRVKRGKESVDLFFLFEWGTMPMLVNGTEFRSLEISDEAKSHLDRLLKDAGVPIAGGRKKADRPSPLQAVLAKSELVEVYSLEPAEEPKKTDESLHDWKVLGKTRVTKAETGKVVLRSLSSAICPPEGTKYLSSLCGFSPRHSLRMKYEGTTFDLLVCFECTEARVRIPGATEDLKGVRKDLAEVARMGFVLLNCRSRADIDRILTDARIPLAKQSTRGQR